MILTDKDIIIDVETSCDIDIKVVGTYKYCLHPSLRLLLLSFSIGDNKEVWTFDVANGTQLPQWFVDVLFMPEYKKHAHNAIFEILVLQSHLKATLKPEQWYCSMAAVAFCGLPLKLEDSAFTLNHEFKKLAGGSDLIKKFSIPKKDGTYNTALNLPQDWSDFIHYNQVDVLTERANLECLPEIPEIFEAGEEREMWVLDYYINSKGLGVDVHLAQNADYMCNKEEEEMLYSIRDVGITNVNSRKQVLEFLQSRGYQCTTLKADDYDKYLSQAENDEIVTTVLNVKRNLSMSSASKFQKFIDTEVNGKIYGTLQYYAANRTGRWGGRGAQPQNLKRNDMDFEYLTLLRNLVIACDYSGVKEYFGNVKETITELGRTVIIPAEGSELQATDFSAIEARVTAWLAGEQWRLDVFRTHGKIYEASAAMMFKVPIQSIAKNSMERMKGKYAELALGFGGWIGAFKKFGADKFMSDKEMTDVAKAWRKANPKIVEMWMNVEECAVSAVRDFGTAFTTRCGITYLGVEVNGRRWLTCRLLSGRRLMYYDPKLVAGRNGAMAFSYRRLANEQDTWYGILVENVVQAIARDLLVHKMITLWKEFGIIPVLHVHDEIVTETEKHKSQEMKKVLDYVMGMSVDWAKTLPLKGDTSILPFYMKGE
jgi:DNA polymerase bacteriophage-type